jgi:NMD protein affecting ribosome stability and mRNA decay
MYYNPNLNVKEWWKRIPDSSDYGTTSYKTIYSYEICPTCESDLVDGKCVICNGDDD